MRLPWRLRWWELLPEVVLGLGLSLFAITEWSAATSALKSGTAIRLMVVVALLWLLMRFLLVRYTRWPLLRVVVFATAALSVLAVVVFPAYDNETVVESLPIAAADIPGPTAPSPAPPPTSSTAASTTTTAPTTTAPRTTIAVPPVAPAASALPAADTPASSPPPTRNAPTTTNAPPITATTIASTTTTTLPPLMTTVPTEPVLLRAADLHGIDHRANGAAVIYRLNDGALVVGLEEIDIQPGPDYDVYVVPGIDRESISDGVRLDDLRGNKGTQYYVVPAGTDVATGDWTVLVWCQTFDVPVAGATPTAI